MFKNITVKTMDNEVLDKLSERIRIYFCYLKDEYSVTFVQIIPYETLSARCDLETLAFGLRLKNSYLE